MRMLIESFKTNPSLTIILMAVIGFFTGWMFDYTLYTYTGRDIGFWNDVWLSMLISLGITLPIYHSKDPEDYSEVRVGAATLGWLWIAAILLRNTFEVSAPFWTI